MVLEVHDNGAEVQFALKDQGPGIAPQDLPHLFDLLYRGKSAAQEKSGLGLGLAIVKRIIEAHGGRLWLESQEGRGATFLHQRLVDRGHSLVVIEHNLEVIKSADWIVDLGPEAGDAGGEVVATGTPEEIAQAENSHTGKFLRRVLRSAGMLPRTKRDLYARDDDEIAFRAAEEPPGKMPDGASRMLALPRNRNGAIHVHGAREHNLKNIDRRRSRAIRWLSSPG